MVEIPGGSLTGIFFVHFVLSSWAMQVSWMPLSYLVYTVFLLVTLLWSIHHRDAPEPVFLCLGINLISIWLDIISISLNFPNTGGSMGFATAMCIINLIARPLTCLMLFRIFNERAGHYSSFGNFGRPGPYENIDHSQSVPQNPMASGSPQHHKDLGEPEQ